MDLTPEIPGTDVKAVGSASTLFDLTLENGRTYVLTTTTASWVAQGSAPTAVAGTDGNFYLPANVQLRVDGACGAKLAIIRAAADGFASLAYNRQG